MTEEEEEKEVDVFENWWKSQRLIPKTHYNKRIALTAWMIRAEICINSNKGELKK